MLGVWLQFTTNKRRMADGLQPFPGPCPEPPLERDRSVLRKKKKPLRKKVAAQQSPPEPPKKKPLKKKPSAKPIGFAKKVASVGSNYRWKKAGTEVCPSTGIDLYLVKPEDMPDAFPTLHALCVPGTLFRVDPSKGVVSCVVTTMTDGVRVAWTNCGICNAHVGACHCRNGVMSPKSVEYIYVRTLADMPTSNGRVDTTSPLITMHGLYWYRARQVEMGGKPAEKVFRPPVQDIAPTVPKKPLRKKSSQPVEDAVTAQGLDLGKFDAIAKDKAAESGRDLVKALSKKPLGKKPLRKKPLRKKA